MTKDTVIGIGLGALVVWLLLRRRAGLGFAAGTSAGGCGCSGNGSRPATCAEMLRATSGGIGNYSQGNGPLPIRNF